jgi:PERQ amino acid-rich with GYF domain-containing protein
VGSSGKAKAPPAVVATPQPVPRTVSSSGATVAKPRPTLQTARSTAPSNQSKANEEFTKWIKGSLSKGLNSNINREYPASPALGHSNILCSR